MQSWDKQVLSHVNNVCNIYQNDILVGRGVLILNIDLEHGRIIFRKENGEGPQVTIWGGAIRIEDTRNYKMGKSEYEEKYQECL